jgi:hypothetical protein
MRSAIALLCCLAAPAILAAADTAVPLTPDSQKAYDTKVKPFLQANCFRCHGDKDTFSGLRLDTLGTDFLKGKTGDTWKEVFDRIGNGTMPPKKEPRPNATEASVVTDWIIQELRSAEKRAKGSSGRIPTRRLNRTEYANTLRDLFYLEENVVRALEQDLPMDGKVDGFDRGGAGLFIDEAQMARYLETADFVLGREVFGPKPKQTSSGRSFFRDKVVWDSKKYLGRYTDLPTYPGEHPLYNDANEMVTVPIGANFAKPTRGGLEFMGTGFNRDGSIEFYGGRWASWKHHWVAGDFADGWYRFRFRAGAFKGTGKFAVDEVKFWLRYAPGTPVAAKESVVIDAPIDQPKEFELMVFLRAGSPTLQRYVNAGWNGGHWKGGQHGGPLELTRESPALRKVWKEWAGFLTEHQILLEKPTLSAAEKEAANQRFKKRFDGEVERFRKGMLEVDAYSAFNPEVDLNAIPRLWIEWVELEGPIGAWPPRGRTELFFDGEHRTVGKQYIHEIFARFLPRAYRRPVEPAEIDFVVAWVLKAQEANKLSGPEAVREGVKMVLCSPDFLLIQEPTGDTATARKLSDHELACRLSYFLWSTMPDAELFKLAAKNKLHEPKILEAQVRRMIADSKATGLVRNFTGQWLKVRDFSSVTTDRNRYRSYDDDLRDSSRREPFEFFKEVLHNDLSILNFVDSDFLVINGRLASHYGIEGVTGNAFRRVAVRPEHRRGGVLGMAGVLTYLSDGIRTLPVRRAAYVLETLWNAPPPPPPPNVGNLPRVGKVRTVRERLEQHRQSDSCASCHARIDPFGIALENYDAIGAWRDRQNGEHFRGDKDSPPIDVSGVLPSGRKFNNPQEFKQALLAEKERFVRGFVEKMLAYALGRPVGATDGSTVDDIIKTLETPDQDKYRLQSLIQAIVASQAFQTK